MLPHFDRLNVKTCHRNQKRKEVSAYLYVWTRLQSSACNFLNANESLLFVAPFWRTTNITLYSLCFAIVIHDTEWQACVLDVAKGSGGPKKKKTATTPKSSPTKRCVKIDDNNPKGKPLLTCPPTNAPTNSPTISPTAEPSTMKCEQLLRLKATSDSTTEHVKVAVKYGADWNGDQLSDLRICISLDIAFNSGTEDIEGVAHSIFEGQTTFGSNLSIVGIKKASSPNGPLVPANGGVGYIAQDSIGGNVPCFDVSGGATRDDYDVAVKVEANQGGGSNCPQFEDGPLDTTVQKLCYTITSSTQDLVASDLDNSWWFVRLGRTNGGSGSSKMVGYLDDILGKF